MSVRSAAASAMRCASVSVGFCLLAVAEVDHHLALQAADRMAGDDRDVDGVDIVLLDDHLGVDDRFGEPGAEGVEQFVLGPDLDRRSEFDRLLAGGEQEFQALNARRLFLRLAEPAEHLVQIVIIGRDRRIDICRDIGVDPVGDIVGEELRELVARQLVVFERLVHRQFRRL